MPLVTKWGVAQIWDFILGHCLVDLFTCPKIMILAKLNVYRLWGNREHTRVYSSLHPETRSLRSFLIIYISSWHAYIPDMVYMRGLLCMRGKRLTILNNFNFAWFSYSSLWGSFNSSNKLGNGYKLYLCAHHTDTLCEVLVISPASNINRADWELGAAVANLTKSALFRVFPFNFFEQPTQNDPKTSGQFGHYGQSASEN